MSNSLRSFAEFSVVVAAGALLAACNGDKPAAGPGGTPPPPEVAVVTVAPGAVTLTQELPGRLEAIRTAQVRARVEGVVEKRLFAEGSDVLAGHNLFLIDARTYQTAAASAEADVAAAKATVDRYKPLLEIKAVSQQEFDQANARWKQAEAALAKARLDLENASVPAPISGRIGRAAVTEGALVGRGEATLLATIEQIDPIYVTFTQSNADVIRLQEAIRSGALKRAEGSRVELMLENGRVYAQPGRMLFSDLAVDPGTGSISMRAEFANPGRQLLPGTFVRVRLAQAQAERALMVPQRAVQSGPQGQYVTLVEEGRAVIRPVKTGVMVGADWVITEGLKGGEQVVVNGLQKTRPGSPVTPVPVESATSAASATPAAAGGK